MTREEILSELQAAGYERFGKLFEKHLTLIHPYEPEMMLWKDGVFFHSMGQAHEHLLETRRVETMEKVIEHIAMDAYDAAHSLHYGDIDREELQKIFARIRTECERVEKS